jgi:DNA repair exonuclease SbcCD ATPase subunit
MPDRWYTDFRKWCSIPFICLLLYLAIDGLTLCFGVRLILPASAQVSGKGGAAQGQGAPTQDRIEDLRRRLEADEKRLAELDPQAKALEDRAKDLQVLLATLATVGTIFGFALGVTTYVNLKDTQENAKTLIEDIRRKAKADLDEIRADFPAIARLNRKIEEILGELRLQVFQEWDQNSYKRLAAPDRQGKLFFGK